MARTNKGEGYDVKRAMSSLGRVERHVIGLVTGFQKQGERSTRRFLAWPITSQGNSARFSMIEVKHVSKQLRCYKKCDVLCSALRYIATNFDQLES